jgi:D-beta-D-heptose 7-phosphate kinase/D-beta-D-heptose 1-phosphate adenosyltransferase
MTLPERKKRLLALLRRFAGARIMVIGDVMADHYIWGDVERISPEAPVPVVHVREEKTLLGGATNVVRNVVALGAQAEVCSVIGDDRNGRYIREQLAELGVNEAHLRVADDRHTTVKSRVIAHNQQVVRVDWETAGPIGAALVRDMLDHVRERLPRVDAIIISDYGKGVVNKLLLDGLREIAVPAGKLVAIDPKIENMRHYHGFTTMTPNHHESAHALGIKLRNDDGEIHRAGPKILKRFRLQSLVITRGEKGMSLFDRRGHVADIPTVAKEVYDVTGAGDTVIAALTCGLAVGGSLHDAALIANFAAGIVIAEVGTAAASHAEVAAAIRATKDLK